VQEAATSPAGSRQLMKGERRAHGEVENSKSAAARRTAARAEAAARRAWASSVSGATAARGPGEEGVVGEGHEEAGEFSRWWRDLQLELRGVLRGGGSARRHAHHSCAPAPAQRARRAAAAARARASRVLGRSAQRAARAASERSRALRRPQLQDETHRARAESGGAAAAAARGGGGRAVRGRRRGGRGEGTGERRNGSRIGGIGGPPWSLAPARLGRSL
jgi:hypothetical protein